MRKKRKVLIVDDEFRIGMLVNKLIRWDEYNLECAAILDNGESALKMIEERRDIDIVVADIRMPKINGLDLVRISQEMGLDIKFIVISGYKEFEYAHTALRYGVDHYLLKPINAEELNTVMKDICISLDAKEKDFQEKKELQKAVAMSETIIRSNFLNHIIEQDTGQSFGVDIPLHGDFYRGIDIKLDYTDYKIFNKKQDRQTVEHISSMVEDMLRPICEDVLICEKENLHIYCLFNYNVRGGKDITAGLNRILSEIKDYLIGFEQYEATIGIGDEKKEFADIRFSIQESHRAVQNRIGLGTGRLIYAKKIAGTVCLPNPVEEYKDMLLASLERFSREEWEQVINRIYSGFFMGDGLDYSQCFEVARAIVEEFFRHIDMSADAAGEGGGDAGLLRCQCEHCYTLSIMKRFLKEELGSRLELAGEAVRSESARPVRQAKQYIGEHYGEKIVLEDIAAVVDLNPVYFSVLFKKETGMNFSTYLVKFRMDKAKEMLSGTNETIAAIGDKVGYKDSRYFSQTFAKIVGVKPALYRKLHS